MKNQNSGTVAVIMTGANTSIMIARLLRYRGQHLLDHGKVITLEEHEYQVFKDISITAN